MNILSPAESAQGAVMVKILLVKCQTVKTVIRPQEQSDLDLQCAHAVLSENLVYKIKAYSVYTPQLLGHLFHTYSKI